MMGLALRRNRFKKRAVPKPRVWQLPAFARDVRRLLRIAGIAAAAAGAVGVAAFTLDRPIHVITMDGAFQRVSPGQVEKVAAPYALAGFMSADLDAIRRAVEAIPWVDKALVARRWPLSLHITVIEQTAVARWNEAGLLNSRGELFVRAATHVPPELPRLSGPPGSEAEVARLYLTAQGRMLEAGLRIAALRLDPRGAWEMDLDNGITVRLGRHDVEERIDRFIHTASQVIAHRLNEVNYVDMRYSNGFAIGWRGAVTPAAAPLKRADDADA